MTCSQWACRATQIQALRGILMQTCTTMSVSTTASGSGDLSGCGRRSRVSARSASASTVLGPELKGAMSAAQHTHTRCSSSTHYQPVSISPRCHLLHMLEGLPCPLPKNFSLRTGGSSRVRSLAGGTVLLAPLRSRHAQLHLVNGPRLRSPHAELRLVDRPGTRAGSDRVKSDVLAARRREVPVLIAR